MERRVAEQGLRGRRATTSSCSRPTGSSGSRSRTTSSGSCSRWSSRPAIGLAWRCILNTAFRGKYAFSASVFYFPAILSMSIVGLIWSWMYHPTLGLINQIPAASWAELAWRTTGCPIPQSRSIRCSSPRHGTMPGLPMLLFLAGLQTIPKECHRGGADRRRDPLAGLRYVTIPLLRETTLIVRRHHRDQFAQGLRHHLRDDLWRPRQPDPGARHLDVFPHIQP